MAARRVLLLDDDAGHQIRIVTGARAHELAVSCVCRQRRKLPPLAAWPGVLPLADALAVYGFHVKRSERLVAIWTCFKVRLAEQES